MTSATAMSRLQFGKYTLVERLGRGGMAEVWKAKISGPAGFQRTMVVKRILPHLVEDEQFKAMFVAEARLSARLNHGNIVQVFELGDVDGELYLAMEYVRGRDLVNVVRAQLLKGLPPPGMGAFVIREVCRALGYAHALADDHGQPLRLIHRDVSPSNVMISFDGAVKLLDFGIAKALAEANEHKTVTGTLKGKFGYMAPEQVEGKEIDHRADLFAAGVVLHEILTGKRLFKGNSDLQTIAMVRDARVEAPSVANPDVPPELDAICLKALARDREARFATCELMAQALDEVVHALKWGPERLAGALRELFPDEPSNSAVVPNLLAAETVPKAAVTVGALGRYQRRRRLAWGAAGLALLGGVAGVVAYWPRSAESPAQTARAPASVPTTTPPTPVPTVAPPVAAPVPATVTVRVVTTPPGADVFVDDGETAAGQTPVALTLPRSTASAHLTMKLRGYATQSADVTPDSNSRLQLTMARVMPPARPVARAKKPKKPTAPTTRPLPDLHRGDVVDPFAR